MAVPTAIKYPHPGADVDFEEAAGVPLAALTALQALRDELGVKPGQKAFISGGAGGVGTFAIQIAKWLGAHVTTTASKRGEALVRSLGADEVIDYTSDDLSRFGKDFDAGFDLIGGETLDRMFKIMKPETRIVSVEDWRWSGLFAASGLTRI
jgi:alcohol dehydrogenase